VVISRQVIYRGRFAPSPTGLLHMGSLVTALGSFLQARSQRGEWLVRIEDIDLPRNQAGAADEILFTLDALGLQWDSDILYQSTRRDAYDEVLQKLTDHLFLCGCSRKELRQNQGVYDGRCRGGLLPSKVPRTIRLQVPNQIISFYDLIQGHFQQHLLKEVGDFVIKRLFDNSYAYQLAVVVDDTMQSITEIVRGCDLLDSTPRQIYLQSLLNYPTPQYAHLPILTNALGQKLSKQTLARPIDKTNPLPALFQALQYLGLPPPPELQNDTLETLLQWAIANWKLSTVPRLLAQQEHRFFNS
jgi:glutamyl-Q tRNA(Asp) synthetase